MNSKFIRTFMVAVIATMSLTFSSCDPDEPYNTPLLGTWELYYINNIEVAKIDVDKFRFDANGTGTYAYYDNYGRWVQDPFTWSSWGSALSLTFSSDYKIYSMSYRIAYDGALEIFNSDLFNGTHLYYPVARSSK